jgi:hypothetical protein
MAGVSYNPQMLKQKASRFQGTYEAMDSLAGQSRNIVANLANGPLRTPESGPTLDQVFAEFTRDMGNVLQTASKASKFLNDVADRQQTLEGQSASAMRNVRRQ